MANRHKHAKANRELIAEGIAANPLHGKKDITLYWEAQYQDSEGGCCLCDNRGTMLTANFGSFPCVCPNGQILAKEAAREISQ
jgi:hypothetical protein